MALLGRPINTSFPTLLPRVVFTAIRHRSARVAFDRRQTLEQADPDKLLILID